MSETVHVQGVAVPQMGFGTWKLNGEACLQSVRHALTLGYRHLDTARMYGNEGEVGRALKLSAVTRDKVFLTSKVWYTDARADDVERELNRSLAALGTDYLDLYLLHWPNPEVPIAETIGALQRARDAGKIRLFGVSNSPAAHLEEAVVAGGVANNQVELHPYLQLPRLRQKAADLGVVITAYAPLAKGRVVDDGVLQKIARELDSTPAQVALRYLMDLGTVVIPKSADPERRRQNLNAVHLQLGATHHERLTALDQGLRLTTPSFGPDWGDQ